MEGKALTDMCSSIKLPHPTLDSLADDDEASFLFIKTKYLRYPMFFSLSLCLSALPEGVWYIEDSRYDYHEEPTHAYYINILRPNYCDALNKMS